METPQFYNYTPQDIIKFNVKNIEISAHFCPDFKNTKSKVVYYIYAFFFLGFFLVTATLSELIDMIMVFGDIEKMTEASFLLLTHIVHYSKVYVFLVHGSKVRRLINSTSREEFKPKNKEQYEMLIGDVKFSKLITKIFLMMCVGTCVSWAIFPLLDKDSDGRIKQPLSGWFPFDVEQSPGFEFAYVYLPLAGMINGLANISMDTFLSGVIMVISVQLKFLNNSFENLTQEEEGTKETQKNAVKILIENINHHRNIMLFGDDFTELFTKCIMAQFVISVIIICITMFQMSLLPVVSVQFLSMVMYQGCMVLEIFLWCYYGNEVILQSEKLTESAYMCQWVYSSPEFRKNLLYFTTRSQVPYKLYAGGYFTLSLETFKAIVKSSWSYFAVLNRVHSEMD